MRYYEVFIADRRHHGQPSLTYSSEQKLEPLSVITIPLRQKMVSGFVISEVEKPDFTTKQIKSLLSSQPLPGHCLQLAHWLSDYYASSLGEALRQFAPSKPSVRRSEAAEPALEAGELQLELEALLTSDQKKAIKAIREHKSTTVLLHGDTASGKTRVYVELAHKTLGSDRSVILLTPEIALTSQLAGVLKRNLSSPIFILHSQQSVATRKRIWLSILEAKEPVVVIGPRSALFAPIAEPGLIILDEAHETSYKQDQAPRYHTSRVASQLGQITGAKVVLGTATPSVSDYYLASQKKAVVRMEKNVLSGYKNKVEFEVVDIKNRQNFGADPYLSKPLIQSIKQTLAAKKQVMIYLNRRGSARLALCGSCGWQLLCPNCDVPLVYHGDEHIARCHICGYKQKPPNKCPACGSLDVLYKSIGTKALADSLTRLFPDHRLQRFDSDNPAGERINELYAGVRRGEVDILVGTQLLAKGFDLPRLGLVGITAAETSLSLPDFTAEERSFQLLYQAIGRVGRGHGKGYVVAQSYNPGGPILQAALNRDWESFYKYVLDERQKYRFPPFAYLLQLVCRRSTSKGAETAAIKLKQELSRQKLPVEIIGPAPNFYGRRAGAYYWQLVLKSKDRKQLVELAKIVPSNWTLNLDPSDLL